MAATDPPPWLDELDLHVGPPDASMGTRALDLAGWFVVDAEWDDQRRSAAALLASARDEVVVGVEAPEVRGPSEELLALVGALVPPEVGDVGEHPLVATRRLVADDVCLLLPDGGRWVLAAGCVCFPSHWRPRDKVGAPLTAIHERVPGYPGALADRVDGFLARLPPGRAVWRRNWLVHHVGDLHAPVPVAPPARPEPQERWLRSERQALVRLVEHDAVAFTIRTQQVRVGQLAARPDVCGALADALAGWSPAQRAYKGQAVDDELVSWLDRRRRAG
jgi:dimethylamine monooxygenase subunit A